MAQHFIMPSLVRTQVLLTSDQADALKKTAAARGVSMAQVVRDAVEAHLLNEQHVGLEARWDRALAAVGRFGSGCSTVARDHDTHLAEAFEE